MAQTFSWKDLIICRRVETVCYEVIRQFCFVVQNKEHCIRRHIKTTRDCVRIYLLRIKKLKRADCYSSRQLRKGLNMLQTEYRITEDEDRHCEKERKIVKRKEYL